MKKIMLMATMMVATLFTGATMINTPDMDLSLALGPGSTINLPGGDLEASATGGHVVGLELEKQLTKRFSISGGLDWLMAGTGWKDHKWKDGDVEYKLKDASVQAQGCFCQDILPGRSRYRQPLCLERLGFARRSTGCLPHRSTKGGHGDL